MREEAEVHAEQDRNRRAFIEIRNKSDNAIYAARKLLKRTADSIDPGIEYGVNQAIEALEASYDREDPVATRAALTDLNRAAKPLATASTANQAAAEETGDISENQQEQL